MRSRSLLSGVSGLILAAAATAAAAQSAQTQPADAHADRRRDDTALRDWSIEAALLPVAALQAVGNPEDSAS